jgi:hypothetical protein
MGAVATSVYLEVGSKKVFACALDWPGWCRSGRTEEAAVETLAAYAARYAPVAERAGVRFPASAGDRIEVVGTVKGDGTTDFGAPGKPAPQDAEPLTAARARRLAALVEASWAVFDDVVAAAPASLRKGPRGGGRDTARIVEHVLGAEASYLRTIGVRMRPPDPADRGAVTAMRAAALDAIRAARAPSPPDLPKGWPYRYAARRIAWHVLDHAWEIEDRST